jgi:hypothetical protein
MKEGFEYSICNYVALNLEIKSSLPVDNTVYKLKIKRVFFVLGQVLPANIREGCSAQPKKSNDILSIKTQIWILPNEILQGATKDRDKSLLNFF